jgi:hypothetical protein
MERILVEVRNQLILTIHNHRMQNYLFYFLAENELPGIVSLLFLRLRIRLSLSGISFLRISSVRILRPNRRRRRRRLLRDRRGLLSPRGSEQAKSKGDGDAQTVND